MPLSHINTKPSKLVIEKEAREGPRANWRTKNSGLLVWSSDTAQGTSRLVARRQGELS